MCIKKIRSHAKIALIKQCTKKNIFLIKFKILLENKKEKKLEHLKKSHPRVFKCLKF